MSISDLFPKIVPNAIKLIKANSPEILTALGVSGVVTTSYLVGKASFKASRRIAQVESVEGYNAIPKERLKARAKLVWREYIPAGVSGVATITCIVAGSKANSRRTAAAVTAYSLTERAFSEYKEKIIEQIGANKEQAVRDGIAQDRVNNTPPGSREIIVIGGGNVLCCELYTNRYFRSDMETLRKAQNDVNAMSLHDLYVNLDEFYELIGLKPTQNSDIMGWTSDKLMLLQFSTVLTDSGEPCLAFEYNYVKPLSEND